MPAWMRWFAIVVPGLMTLATLALWFGIVVVNPTTSLPRGIYIRTWGPIEYGSIVVFPVPESIRPIVRPDVIAFMKPVVAMNGDTICTRDRMFFINGEAYAEDTSAMPAPTWHGCEVLTDRQLAVGSHYVETSADSRLYGAISKKDAVLVRPLLTEDLLK